MAANGTTAGQRPAHRRFGMWPGVVALVVPAVFMTVVALGLGLSSFAILVVGTAWALLLVPLNRWTVRTMRRQGPATVRMPPARYLVSVLMALGTALTGTVLHHGDELGQRVLESNAAALREALDALPTTVPALEAQERRQRGIVDDLRADGIERDPELVALRNSLAGIETRLAAVEAELPCEADGECGSGLVGADEVFDAKVRLRDDLIAQRDRTIAEIGAAELRISQRIAAEEGALTRLSADVRAARAQESADEARLVAEHGDTGFPAQVSALTSERDLRFLAAPAVLFCGFLLLDVGILTVVAWWRRPAKPRSPAPGGHR